MIRGLYCNTNSTFASFHIGIEIAASGKKKSNLPKYTNIICLICFYLLDFSPKATEKTAAGRKRFRERKRAGKKLLAASGRNHSNLFKSYKYILFDLFLFVRFLAEGDRKKLQQAEIIIKIYQISLFEDEQEKEKKCRKNTISAIFPFL